LRPVAGEKQRHVLFAWFGSISAPVSLPATALVANRVAHAGPAGRVEAGEPTTE
jgi:hypothetical protein